MSNKDIHVLFFNDSGNIVSERFHDLTLYLDKFKNRTISILYLLEEKKPKKSILRYVKRLHNELLSIDEISHMPEFFQFACKMHTIYNMIESDSLGVREEILDIANDVARLSKRCGDTDA